MSKINATPVSSFDYNQSPSPSPDSTFELEEDLRTFEEKYKILENVILGEGCASVVKECVRRVTSPGLKQQAQNPCPCPSGRRSEQGQRQGGARARVAGGFGSSPLVFGKNLVIPDDGSKDLNSLPVGQKGSSNGIAGLRLKILKCDKHEEEKEEPGENVTC